MPMLTIHKKEPVAITAEQVLVSFRRKKVAEDQSFRAVVVPAYTFPKYVEGTDQNVSNIFAEALQEVFMDAAGSILRDFTEANTTATEMPEENLAFSVVVNKMAEMQTSQRLNADQIKAWFDASATKTKRIESYGADEKGQKKLAALREKYASLASNNPGVDTALASKMLAYIEADDLGSTVAKALVKRLDRLTKEKVDADEL